MTEATQHRRYRNRRQAFLAGEGEKRKKQARILWKCFNSPIGQEALKSMREISGDIPYVEPTAIGVPFSPEVFFTKVGMVQFLDTIEWLVYQHEQSRKEGVEE